MKDDSNENSTSTRISLISIERLVVTSDQSADSQNQEGTKDTNGTRWQWARICVVVSLVYVNFWVSASVSLLAPFFPKEAESKGATPSQYGLVLGVYELVIILVSPVIGRMIPTVSPRLLITAGVTICGTCCALFGVLDLVPAGTLYIALVFLIRIFEGFGAASFFTTSFTIVASEFPDSVATSFSWMETAYGLGFIVGPTIGGALYQLGGFLLPFVVNGGFLIVGCIPFICLQDTTCDTKKEGGARGVLQFLKDGGIICFSLSIISALLLVGFNTATLEPHMRQFNSSPLVLGLIFVVPGGIYAISSPIWGYICDHGANPLYVTIFGYFLCGIGLLFVAPVPFIPFQPTLATVIGSLVPIGFGIAAKLVAAFIGVLLNASKRGFPDNLAIYAMISALFSMLCSIGAFVGPTMGGFLLDTTGYRMGTLIIFSIETFLMLIMIAYVFYSRNSGHTIDNSETVQQSISD